MNKRTTMIVTAALGISLAAFPVYAQKGKPVPRTGDKTSQTYRTSRSMERRFDKMLNLTPAQQSNIHPILKKQGEQLRAIHQNKKLTPGQKREQSKKIFFSTPGKINKYLTKPQRVELKEMMDRFKNSNAYKKAG